MESLPNSDVRAVAIPLQNDLFGVCDGDNLARRWKVASEISVDVCNGQSSVIDTVPKKLHGSELQYCR